jgi:hypothetical protein
MILPSVIVIRAVATAVAIGATANDVNENQKHVQKKQSIGFLKTCKGILSAALTLIGIFRTSNHRIAMAIIESDNSKLCIMSLF